MVIVIFRDEDAVIVGGTRLLLGKKHNNNKQRTTTTNKQKQNNILYNKENVFSCLSIYLCILLNAYVSVEITFNCQNKISMAHGNRSRTDRASTVCLHVNIEFYFVGN